MALLDAGVPLKNPVAGLSIGLVTSDRLEKAFPLGNELPAAVSTYVIVTNIVMNVILIIVIVVVIVLTIIATIIAIIATNFIIIIITVVAVVVVLVVAVIFHLSHGAFETV